MKKDLKYPIFLKVSQCEHDLYWQYIFEEMAYDMCPFGVYIDHSSFSVHCNLKGKQFNYGLQDKSAEDIHTELIQLFKTKLNLYSKNEYLQSRTHLNEQLKIKFESWKEIKKKSIKDILLENFILSLREKIGCSYVQLRKLLSILQMAFHFKMITHNDVIIDPHDNKIVDIVGFNAENLNTMTLVIPTMEMYKTDKTTDNQKTDLIALWEKYIKIDS